jgi:hypothetical protein
MESISENKGLRAVARHRAADFRLKVMVLRVEQGLPGDRFCYIIGSILAIS